VAQEAEEVRGEFVLVESTPVAENRKSWRKLMCHTVVSNLQQRRWKDDDDDV